MDILSAVRSGRCSTAVLSKLQDRCGRPLGMVDSILPTKVRLHQNLVPPSCAGGRACMHGRQHTTESVLLASFVGGISKHMCVAVQLYTHTDDVDAINSRHLAELSGEAVRFVAQDTGNPDALRSACHVRSQSGPPAAHAQTLSKSITHVTRALPPCKACTSAAITWHVTRQGSGLPGL